MKDPQIQRLQDKGKAVISNVDNRGSVHKQAVASGGKIRIAVSKDNTDGKKNN
jgi:hypothetical protein